MDQPEPRHHGLFGAVRQLFSTMVGMIQNRVELISVELQEEKTRAIGLLIWTALCILFAVLAAVMITFTLVFLCPEEKRVYPLIGFSLFYLLGAAAAFLSIKRRIQNRPPFAETIAQLKKDREWLRTRD